MADITIREDNTDKVIKGINRAVSAALEKIGLKAETYAKQNITKQGAVDTGNLRNSITHATTKDAVYIGTNVEYAPYVELGTSRGMKPRPYLKPAAQDHADEYRRIFKSELEG